MLIHEMMEAPRIEPEPEVAAPAGPPPDESGIRRLPELDLSDEVVALGPPPLPAPPPPPELLDFEHVLRASRRRTPSFTGLEETPEVPGIPPGLRVSPTPALELAPPERTRSIAAWLLLFAAGVAAGGYFLF
jgi:hypothetical protein